MTVLAAASWRRPGATPLRCHWPPSVLGLFVYPLYILTKTRLIVGAGIQPRYLLPILIMILAWSSLQHRAPGCPAPRRTASRPRR